MSPSAPCTPLAGISVDFMADQGRTKFTVLERYPAALREAGVRSVFLPPSTADLSSQLDLVDGVVLTGGDDLDPALWGAMPPEDYDPSDARRTAYEAELVRACILRDIPLLGICLGLQLLNVARGGSLCSGLGGASVDHSDPVTTRLTRHAVTLVPGTHLARALGHADGGSVDVDSQHRWAPDRLGEGLVVAARSADGVVEAAELPGHPFCVGVQWHPESGGPADPAAVALFRAFAEACRVRADARTRAGSTR